MFVHVNTCTVLRPFLQPLDGLLYSMDHLEYKMTGNMWSMYTGPSVCQFCADKLKGSL